MASFMAKFFEKKDNLKRHKFSKEFTTQTDSKSPLLSRGKFHRLTYIFMAIFLLVDYNLY